MEEIDGQHAVLVMVTVDVRIIVIRGRHPLPFLYLAHGDQQIAVLGGEFELLRGCGCLHALLQRVAQLCLPAFQKHLRVAHRFPVCLGRGEVSTQGPRQRLM